VTIGVDCSATSSAAAVTGGGGANPFQQLAVEIWAGGVDILLSPFLTTSIKTLLASKEHFILTCL